MAAWVGKVAGPTLLSIIALLLLAMPQAEGASLAGPDPGVKPTPEKIAPISLPGGAQVLIKTSQYGIPSAVLEWKAGQLSEEEGIHSFMGRGSPPSPFTSLSVGWLATDHNMDPAEFEVAIRTRKGEEPWAGWVHTRGDTGPAESPSGLFWSPLYIPSDFGVHTDFEIGLRAPIGVSLTSVRVCAVNASAGLKISGFVGELPRKTATIPLAAPSRPPIITRSEWWGDLTPDELDSPRWRPSFQDITHALVHHTVTTNNPPNPAQVVRDIWMQHANWKGWGDIGYNFLIDHFGNIYHGRCNPELDTEDVIGAHAMGYNTGSMGIALIGQFHPAWPDPPAGEPDPRALRSTEGLLAWRFYQRDLDPLGRATLVDDFIYRIAGHRDVAATDCPGDRLYALLPTIRTNVRHGSESREVRLTLCFAVQKSKPDIYQEFKGQVLHLAQNGLEWVSRTLSMTIFRPSGPGKIRVVG